MKTIIRIRNGRINFAYRGKRRSKINRMRFLRRKEIVEESA
jgi:hypothetical protein